MVQGYFPAPAPLASALVNRRVKRILRTVSVAACILVFAAACSNDGYPQSYDEQIDPESGLSNVERNWRDGCELRYETDLAEDANGVCRCAFEQIRTIIPWDDFVEMDKRLGGDSSLISGANENQASTEYSVVQIIADCIERG